MALGQSHLCCVCCVCLAAQGHSQAVNWIGRESAHLGMFLAALQHTGTTRRRAPTTMQEPAALNAAALTKVNIMTVVCGNMRK